MGVPDIVVDSGEQPPSFSPSRKAGMVKPTKSWNDDEDEIRIMLIYNVHFWWCAGVYLHVGDKSNILAAIIDNSGRIMCLKEISEVRIRRLG